MARNQEELDSIDRSTRELLKLEAFYNQDPLRYLNKGDSYFKDLDVGHVVTETGFFSEVERDYLETKTFREAWDYNDPDKQENWRNAIRKEIRDMIRRGVCVPSFFTLNTHFAPIKRIFSGMVFFC